MDSGDQDFYQFRAQGPASLVVSIENRSPTLVPALRVLNGDKNDISGWSSASTAGGNLRYAFTAEADSIYYVHVTSSWERTSGEYTLTVKEE